MSDPVTNVQIEDVLSSIRKLVSEEIRSQTRDAGTNSLNAAEPEEPSSTPASAPAPSKAEANDRLILTPALRVDSADKHEADFIHAEPSDQPGDGEADLLSLMERVRAAGEQVSRKEQKPLKGIKTLKPEVVEDQTTPEMAIESALAALVAGDDEDDSVEEDDTLSLTPNADVSDVFVDAEEVIDAAEYDEDDIDLTGAEVEEPEAMVAEVEADDDITPAAANTAAAMADITTEPDDNLDTIVPTFLRHRGVESLHQRVADVASVIRDQGGDWEPEADEETDAAPGPQPSALPWADEVEDEAGSAQTPNDEAAADEDWQVDPVENADKAAMQDAARAHLRVAASTPETRAPEVEAPTEAAKQPDVADIAQAFADAQAAEDWEDADYGDDLVSADDQDALTAEDPTVIDEEMLRDMVAEIVRQELQGALGERITRNVRKLVRREIHRALSAHEID
ncbi:hypothetical protein [Pseudooceanicola sp. MF1-13]|uniref:hypothetical protein n=1 Tax=Pseudooceanicola sp. MF1-13 TaxID=3379095 RepID=UPI003891718E